MNEATPIAGLARLVRAHALGWLLAANGVGVWLAAILVWPQAGDGAGALGYGRWMPLHLNWQLYGWCSLPLVGALLAGCLEPRHPRVARHVGAALAAWSLALALGGVSWLAGETSGKLFLDWSGVARPALSLAMIVLWSVVAAHLWWGRSRASGVRWRSAAGLVGLLTVVPSVLYWAAGRDVYPSVNPDSGGATGAALLGSTLGIVAVFGLVPVLLGLPWTGGARGRTGFWLAWTGSLAVFGLIDHGHASHHAPGQIIGLGLLLIWVPLLGVYARSWAWSECSLSWVKAAGWWWLLLVASGWVTFLPGASEASKFTHVLVGHAHLAMAGLLTAVNFAILNELDPQRPVGGRLVRRLWNGATVAHVALVTGLGLVEAQRPADLFYGAGWTDGVLLGRLLAGLAMLVASVLAWRECKQ